MPVRTRRSTRKETKKNFDELARTIKNLSVGKKATMKRTISKMRSNMLTKKERKRKESVLKKKYGKFYKTYKQLEPRLTAHLANKIITISIDYDKAQNKLKRDLKKLKTYESKMNGKFQQLEKEREQLEDNLAIASPSWREKNISPHVLRNLTQSEIDQEIGSSYTKLGVNSNKQRGIMDQLMDIRNQIAEVESRIDLPIKLK